MNKTHKKLALISIAAFVIEAAVVIGVATNLSGNVLSPIKAETVDSKITFSNFKNVNSVASSTTSLYGGGTITATGTGAAVSGGAASMGNGKSMFFSYANNGIANTTIFIDGVDRDLAPFENITAVKADFVGSGTLSIFYSLDGSTFLSKTLSDDVSADISGAKYVYLKETKDEWNSSTLYSIEFSYTCNGEPAEKSLSSISLSGTYKTAFEVGDTFNHTGAVVTAHYNDSTSIDVTSSATFTTPDLSSEGEKTVTVSYSDEYGSASTTYSINVVTKELLSIALSGTYPTEFEVGDSFSHDGMVVTASYNTGDSQVVTNSVTFSGYNMSTEGDQTVTVSYSNEYGSVSTTYSITVKSASTKLTGLYKYAGFTTYVLDFNENKFYADGNKNINYVSFTYVIDGGSIIFTKTGEAGSLTYSLFKSGTTESTGTYKPATDTVTATYYHSLGNSYTKDFVKA